MKKSLITMVAALALVGVVGAGATLAYLTDVEGDITNTFTIGKVDIDLEETVSTNDTGAKVSGNDKTGYDFTKVEPGDVYGKNPVVTVAADSEDCYVFVKVTGDDNLVTNMDTARWIAVDGDATLYRYYEVCKADDKLDVFTTVTVKADVEEGTKFENIVVKSLAIQAGNMDVTAAETEALKTANWTK